MNSIEEQSETLDFCEITFAVPAQQFGITCSLSAEEALPVVTEFALRVIHVCDSVTPSQLQSYFGFGQAEVTAIIQTLLSERLVMWVEEWLELTPYARGRFIESTDGIPRFFKIKDYNADLVFDLMSFVPSQQTRDRVNRVGTMMELVPKDSQRESRAKVEAERSFQKHFHRVYKGGRAEIYKISDVEAGPRFYIPLSCRFAIDVQDGATVRRVLSDNSFDERLEISSAISKVLSLVEPADNPQFAEFASAFTDSQIGKYLVADQFDLKSYLRNVHLQPFSYHVGEAVPIIGNLHLESNRALLLSRLKSDDLADTENAYWLAPETRYWSRSRSINGLARSIAGLLKKNRHQDGDEQANKVLLKVLLQAPRTQEREITNIYGGTFSALFSTKDSVMGRRTEIFLCPGRVMCALYYFRTKDSPMAIPMGIISSKPDHLLKAAELFTHVCASRNVYKLDQKDGRTPAKHSDFWFVPEVKEAPHSVS